MRAIVQRVTRASVTIDGAIHGAIENGVLVYLGIGKGDGDTQRAWMLDKILGLRIFADDEGKMNKSVLDIGGSLLVISQFTLYGDTKKGRRPGFDAAMPPAEAEAIYDVFVKEAKARIPTQTGRFGADMKVESLNDGPVTFIIETP